MSTTRYILGSILAASLFFDGMGRCIIRKMEGWIVGGSWLSRFGDWLFVHAYLSEWLEETPAGILLLGVALAFR